MYSKKWWGNPEGNHQLWSVEDFCPSTDIAAAWQIVEHMRRRGFATNLLGGPSENVCWRAEVIAVIADAPKRLYWNNAETAPLAICRAALAAVGNG